MRTMAVALLAGMPLLAACDTERPAPAPQETTATLDGEEVTLEQPEASMATASPAPPPGDEATPTGEPTLFNVPNVPAGDVAEDRATLTAIPARFLGQWDAVDGPCAPQSEFFLTIRPGTITFYESQGEVTAVRRGEPGIVVTLGMQGEGEAWTSQYAMRLIKNGEQLATRVDSDSGAGTTRRRCPPPTGMSAPGAPGEASDAAS